MVIPKSKTQSEDSCLNADFSNSTILDSSQIFDNFTISNRFDWNDQEQGSILEQGILRFNMITEKVPRVIDYPALAFLKIPKKADILSDIPVQCYQQVMLSENMVNVIS